MKRLVLFFGLLWMVCLGMDLGEASIKYLDANLTNCSKYRPLTPNWMSCADKETRNGFDAAIIRLKNLPKEIEKEIETATRR